MEDLRIQGSGGGGKAEKAHTPVEAPNTLQSHIKGKIIDMIAYGPIKGLVNGLKSVYLDNTPVQNADGSMNFNGVEMIYRLGYPDQAYMEGFEGVQNTFEINTEVKFDSPVIRSVSNNDSDYAIVTLQAAALQEQAANGDSVGTQLPIAIDVRYGAGAWSLAISDVIDGKTTSPYPVSYRVPLDGVGEPDLRVRRLNQESTDSKKQDALSWTLLTEVIDEKLSYPNIAMVGISVDSKLFGNQIPARSYDVDLSIISVPSNYNTLTREYTGIWDGNFKQDWTDNPAWAFYDLATHPVIGAGLENVDKWAVYRIGQYCDELVEDGYGGMEPRFTCNTIFAEQEDAVAALSTLASCFRGMAYWGTNTMVPVADMPAGIAKVVSPANVIDGDFEYTGTGMRERHSVCVAMWNDPADAGRAVPEIYEDPDSIVLFGWRETRVTAVACNSRGQARRLAKWILYSERMETQTVAYKATMDHADLRPGQLIELADPDYQGARMGGRILSGTSLKLTLDKVPTATEILNTSTWFISVPMPNGSIAKAEISSFTGDVANLLVALPDVPIVGAMWALSCLELQLPQFRVVSVNEDDNGEFTVNATEYDPRKYNIVEKDLILPDRPTSLFPSGTIMPPLDLSFQAYTYFAGDTRHQGLVISWTPPKDVRVTDYILDVKSPSDGGFRTVYNGPGLSFDLLDAQGGEWVIRVRSVASGVPGEWVTRTVQIATLLLPVPPDSVKVTEATFSITLTPMSAYPNLLWEFWRSNAPLGFDQIESNATKLPTGTYLVDAGLRAGRTYFYYVRGTNQYGLSSWFSTQGTTLVDFDDILEAVTEDVINGDLYQLLNSQIENVASNTASQVVDQALEGIQEQIDGLKDALAYVPTEAYLEGDVVRSGKKLWQAQVSVPADPSGLNGPPNPAYWKDVGSILNAADAAVAQVQINTQKIEEVDGKVQAAATQLNSLQAKAREDNGEGDALDALSGYRSQANFFEEVKTLASADYAITQRITSFEAVVGANSAKLVTLEQTMVSTDQALSQRIDTLSTDFQGNKASVQQQLTAVSNQSSSTATTVGTLQATVGGNTASIQTVQSAQADLQGKLTTQLAFKLQLTADGRTYAAGMGLDITTQGGITQSQILFQANRIAMINTDSGNVTLPFLMENGTAYFNSAMFKTASIDFAFISDTLQSSNYVAGQTGWRLGKTGAFELNGNVAGQGRMVITNERVRIYYPDSQVIAIDLGISV